jgi:hypothetical protein
MGILAAQEAIDETCFLFDRSRERQTAYGPRELRQSLPSRHARHPIMIRPEEFADRQPTTDLVQGVDADLLASARDSQGRVAHGLAGKDGED